jgi:carbonic anhydrase
MPQQPGRGVEPERVGTGLEVTRAWPALPPRAQQALNELLAGNERFQSGHSRHPHESKARRQELEEGQHPMATFFGCVDSRVPDEVVLDQGLGDLFTVRTAGHVVDSAVLGSLEFGVHELGIPLIMVLGHERCGAVAAAIDAVVGGLSVPGAIGHLVAAIRPAVEGTRGILEAPLRLDAAVRRHTRTTAAALLDRSPILATAVDEGRLGVVAAHYGLHSGEVQPA